MLEEPLEVTIHTMEEEQKNFVYQMILTTFLEQRVSQWAITFMVQNIKLATAQSAMFMSTMHRVLFAMFLPEPQLSWFLLSLCAHHPGPGSTTAI